MIFAHVCPHCGSSCSRDEAHNGVAMLYGPWGCGNCGWSEYPEYDSRYGIRRHGDDRVFDQYGVSHHIVSTVRRCWRV